MTDPGMRVRFDPARIDALFSRFNTCDAPGVVIGIALHGQPVYRRGFGLANLELPVTLSSSMRLRIGSTTKHFTALAYLLLCEEGKAALDDPIGQYLPELHPVTHGVTLLQLMCNVGGLRDVCDLVLRFSGAGRPVSAADALSLYRDLGEINAAPGTSWIYNNSGYLMLSAAIERITDQPLETVLQEKIFKPVGMNDTLLRRYDTDFVPNSAALHMINLRGDYEKAYFGIDFAGAGAMVSTVDDMLRWTLHMDRPVVGSEKTWALLKTPYTLRNGTSTGYAMGLMLGSHRGLETLSHPGGGMGGNAQMIKVPGIGLDVVIMINRHDVQSMQLAYQVIDACLPELPSDSATQTQPPLTGTFRSRHSGRTIQLYADTPGPMSSAGACAVPTQTVSIDGFDLPYVWRSATELAPAPVWQFIKRTLTLVGPAGSPHALRLNDFGNVEEFSRTSSADAQAAARLEGRYRSDSTGAEAIISRSGSAQDCHLLAIGRFGSTPYVMHCIAEGIWRACPATPMNLGGVVSVCDGVAGFDFFSYGNRAVRFHRCS